MAQNRQSGPDDLRLFEVWMDTTRWLLERTERFPKRLRHTLTDRIDSLSLEILELVTSAMYRREKRRELNEANDRLNRLRVVIRLCHEMKLFSHDQYEEAAHRMGEAGKMLGAWIKQQGRGGTAGGEQHGQAAGAADGA